MIFPPGNPAKFPSSYSLTFTTPGRFEYWCLIHADVGQRGTIVVQ
jgi:plastocyanin